MDKKKELSKCRLLLLDVIDTLYTGLDGTQDCGLENFCFFVTRCHCVASKDLVVFVLCINALYIAV